MQTRTQERGRKNNDESTVSTSGQPTPKMPRTSMASKETPDNNTTKVEKMISAIVVAINTPMDNTIKANIMYYLKPLLEELGYDINTLLPNKKNPSEHLNFGTTPKNNTPL